MPPKRSKSVGKALRDRKTSSKMREKLRALQMREKEAKDKGLTEKEMLDLYGREWMGKSAGPNTKYYGTKKQTEGYYEAEKDIPSYKVKRKRGL